MTSDDIPPVSPDSAVSPRDQRTEPGVRQPIRTASGRDVDIAIVGGGLSGSLAAVLLSRAGYRVAVVDIHPVYPPDFRCEKLDEEQLTLLDAIGMSDCLAGVTTPIEEMCVARFGRLIERKKTTEHGFLYDHFVNAVRARIPADVDFLVGRVAGVDAGPKRQRLILSDGRLIDARLIVLATGLGDAVRQMVGIKRRMIRPGHSVTFGFSMTPAAGHTFEFPALTYYSERVADRLAYISIFPIGDAMRANLFGYRGHDDPWTRAFCRAPHEALFTAMPVLLQFIGEFIVLDKVRMRMADLYVADNCRRDGVVLVGDAFQTTCPAAGTGVDRVLTDVSRLCNVHVPRWFATPGMGADKIAQFYDDPVKQACDAQSAYDAEYCRSFSLDRGLRWQAVRWRAYLRPRLGRWLNSGREARPTLVTSNLR